MVDHLGRVFKILIIHALLGVIDLSDRVACKPPGILVIVQAVPDKGAVLNFDGETQRVGAGEVGSRDATGVGEVAFGHWQEVERRQNEGRGSGC